MQSLIAWTQKKERIERERERTILLRNSKKEIERKNFLGIIYLQIMFL
jgi:hypothetical protein